MADAAEEKKKGKGKRNSANGRTSRNSFSQYGSTPGPVVNGFDTILEPPALRCAPSNVAPYTMPQEALVFEPGMEDIVCLFKNGDKERKIHNNIELDENEKEALAALQQEAKAQGVSFLPSITAMATRFLSRARGDPKKAVTLMQATQAWRMEYFQNGPVSDEQVREDLKHGIVYFTGRDGSLRPTIVVRPRRIPQEWYRLKCIDRMIRVLIFCMEYMLWHMLIPGRIENTNVIIDLKGLGISQLPVSALGDIYKVMSHHYIGRVFKFYVVNLSWVLNTISGAVKALLTDRQKQKLCILDDVKALAKDFALHQLENDLGGSRPEVKEFFPFPVPPGPFAIGSSAGPANNSCENCHEALAPTQAARQGKLWSPSLSKEDNVALDYSPAALSLFERCNYPVPPNCPRPKPKEEESPSAPEVPQSAETRLSQKAMRQSLKDLGITTCDLNVQPGESPRDHPEESTQDTQTKIVQLPEEDLDKRPQDPTQEKAHDPTMTRSEWGSDDEEEDGQEIHELQDEAVKPGGGGWWCRSCSVSSRA